jgi:endonuclease YncB( thermonuclease family)
MLMVGSRLVGIASLASLLLGCFDATVAAQRGSRKSHAVGVEPAFVGVVRHVVDGDTIDVTRVNGEVVRVRLEGIDCPERNQPFSRAATAFTRQLVFEKAVKVAGTTWDQYGRLVARVSIGGEDVSVGLLQAGLAWHFLKYSSDRVLAGAESRARQDRRGLWSEASPVPPWVQRRLRRKATPGSHMPMSL